MKLLYILLAFIFVQSANAQDICKQVTKYVSDNKLQFDYASPFNPENTPPLRVKRSISFVEEYPFDNFFIVFRATCGLDDVNVVGSDGSRTEKKEKTLHVEFADNSSIIDDTVEVFHDVTEDRTEAVRYIFYKLNDATVEEFSTKKITKFIIGGQERNIPADSADMLMKYVMCIKTAKQDR